MSSGSRSPETSPFVPVWGDMPVADEPMLFLCSGFVQMCTSGLPEAFTLDLQAGLFLRVSCFSPIPLLPPLKNQPTSSFLLISYMKVDGEPQEVTVH